MPSPFCCLVRPAAILSTFSSSFCGLDFLSNQKQKIVVGIARLAFWCFLLFCSDRLLFSSLYHGLNRYFGTDRQNEIVFIGNSRTALGVDHRLVESQTGRRCAKFALNGANASNRFAMVEHILDTQGNCEAIVFDVSGYSFNDRNLSAAAYQLLYPYMNSPPIGNHISQKCKNRSEVFVRRLFWSSRFNSTTLGLSIRGWFGRDDNLKFSTVDLERVQRRIDNGKSQSLDATSEGRQLFDDTVSLVSTRNCKIVLLHLPVIKMLNDQDRSRHDANVAIFRECAEQSPNVYFLDYNTPYESRVDLLYDGIHLNAKGKEIISAEIAKELGKLLGDDSSH